MAGESWEAYLASAVWRLVKLDKREAALALAESSIVRMIGDSNWSRIDIELAVPGNLFDALTDPAIYENRPALTPSRRSLTSLGLSYIVGRYSGDRHIGVSKGARP